jgi:hypothetical protein
LNRISAINDSVLGSVASYGYMGTSRRVSLDLGNGVSQSVLDSGVATGLDQFGRIRDLLFKNGANTVHRYEYTYDRAGNRKTAKVKQTPAGGSNHENDRSYAYAYDDLQRLISAQMGKLAVGEDGNPLLDASGKPYVESGAAGVHLRRELNWSMDALGNWTGSPARFPTPYGLSRSD